MEQILFHTSLLNKVQLEKDTEEESGPYFPACSALMLSPSLMQCLQLCTLGMMMVTWTKDLTHGHEQPPPPCYHAGPESP